MAALSQTNAVMDFIEAHIFRRIPVTSLDGYAGFKALTIASAALTIIIGGLLALDPRMLGTELTWLKPFKFAISFAVLFGTLALFTSQLSYQSRFGLVAVVAVVACAAAFLFEMTYMIGQAARVELSHFNESSGFHEMMYGLMGLGATSLMLSVLAIGVLVVCDRTGSIGPAIRLAIGLAAVITATLTFWIGGELAGNGGRFIGTPSLDGAKIPLLGWSMEVGDLRPAHFLSLHALQVIPLIGWLVDRHQHAIGVVWSSAILYSLLTVVVFFQALSGAPLLSL
jgi:hypothetical protein